MYLISSKCNTCGISPEYCGGYCEGNYIECEGEGNYTECGFYFQEISSKKNTLCELALRLSNSIGSPTNSEWNFQT